MATRLSTEELAAALGRQLGGAVESLHRLSGGASRVTSSFDLRAPGGGVQPLILQMDRGDSAPTGRARMEADLLRAAAAAGVPVPGGRRHGGTRRARGELVGGRAPRGGDDPAQAAA